MDLKISARRLRPAVIQCLALAIGSTILLMAGCAQPPPPAPPPPAAVHAVKPLDWYHRQLAAARAAKRAHQPASDTAGAQGAYDEVMRTACLQAATLGSGKYAARCDSILHQPPSQPLTDPCQDNPDDPAVQADCGD